MPRKSDKIQKSTHVTFSNDAHYTVPVYARGNQDQPGHNTFNWGPVAAAAITPLVPLRGHHKNGLGGDE